MLHVYQNNVRLANMQQQYNTAYIYNYTNYGNGDEEGTLNIHYKICMLLELLLSLCRIVNFGNQLFFLLHASYHPFFCTIIISFL